MPNENVCNVCGTGKMKGPVDAMVAELKAIRELLESHIGWKRNIKMLSDAEFKQHITERVRQESKVTESVLDPTRHVCADNEGKETIIMEIDDA